MKKQIFALAVTAAALMSFSAPAAAFCIFNCGPVQAPSPNLNFTVGAASLSGGAAGSEALGNLTLTSATEHGLSSDLVTLGASGGLGGANGATGGWMAQAMASHTATSAGMALSGGFGPSAALVQGATSGNASANLSLIKD